MTARSFQIFLLLSGFTMLGALGQFGGLILWLWSFLLPLNWHGDNFFTYLHLAWSLFFHVYCLTQTFFFGTVRRSWVILGLILWLRSFLLLCLNWHGDNFLNTFTWLRVYFSMFSVWHGLLSFVLIFLGLRIKALFLQDKCIYTIFKMDNQEIQFPLLCTKPSTDKHTFLSFKGW